MTHIEAIDFALDQLRANVELLLRRHQRNMFVDLGADILQHRKAIYTLEYLREYLEAQEAAVDDREPSFMKHLPPEVQGEIRAWQP